MMFVDEYIPTPPVQSTVTHKKEDGVQTTVSDPPNVMKLTSRRVTVDFPAVPEKKRRMKVKKFNWNERKN